MASVVPREISSPLTLFDPKRSVVDLFRNTSKINASENQRISCSASK